MLLFVSYVNGLFEILDRICQTFRRAETLPVSTIKSRTAMTFLPLVHPTTSYHTHTCKQFHIQTQVHTQHTQATHINMNHFLNLMLALLCSSHIHLCSMCVCVVCLSFYSVWRGCWGSSRSVSLAGSLSGEGVCHPMAGLHVQVSCNKSKWGEIIY